jgi:hypothetical protein
MWRSVLAVVAGIAVLTIASFAIEAAADSLLLHLFPQSLPNQAALAQNLYANLLLYLYTALCVLAGGYVTAWIARRAPVWHAVAMGVIEAGLTFYAMRAFPHQAPLRNWIVGMVTVIPVAWLGGVIGAACTRRQPPLSERASGVVAG